ncbi:pyrazinamidase/nicotinamidase [Spiroplasma sabaudiense Ar-1343]|uniref:nicotinamidase n=1 Tax=Spiroplasma sabaudiense Ar-1343 TaxID=1276257 RepID=W6AAN9_9MOLU|nr:isochorismatase family protein [Spiroplasma sabaudiense]AHI53920.1 pyrazinamidase/nicotinamidase [Spiroplasma sabaudiense Ar-1343]
MKKALLIVDFQYDFVNPNGSLFVPGADKIGPYIESLMDEFKGNDNIIIASKDWHPSNHYSFKQWGNHCEQGKIGSELVLNLEKIDYTILKGQDENIESYSAFFDEKGNSNGLNELLQKLKIIEITIVGVATDICVANTVSSAVKLGYKTNLDLNGCAGFNNILTL